MDPVLSHGLAAVVGSVPALIGAAAYALRTRAKRDETISNAVLDAMKSTRADMEQTKEWAKEAISMSKADRTKHEECEKRANDSDKRADECDDRVKAIKGELDELRREVRSGHARRDGRY